MKRLAILVGFGTLLMLLTLRFNHRENELPVDSATASATNTPSPVRVDLDGAVPDVDYSGGIAGSASLGSTLAMTNVVSVPSNSLFVGNGVDIPLIFIIDVTNNVILANTRPSCDVCDQEGGHYEWTLSADTSEEVEVSADVALSGTRDVDDAVIDVSVAEANHADVTTNASYHIAIDPTAGSVTRRY